MRKRGQTPGQTPGSDPDRCVYGAARWGFELWRDCLNGDGL